MKKAKFYAVKVGRKTGIYNDWLSCKEQVINFSGAVYKSFDNLKDAQSYLDGESENLSDKANTTLDVLPNEAIAYVDGSFRKDSFEYGLGVVLITNDKVIELFDKGSDKNVVKSRNVVGELFATLLAIKTVKNMNKSKITIFYDYQGIEAWANGHWKCNLSLTQNYKKMIDQLRRDIDINFVKVKAHSGDKYNEKADYLAKKSLGLV